MFGCNTVNNICTKTHINIKINLNNITDINCINDINYINYISDIKTVNVIADYPYDNSSPRHVLNAFSLATCNTRHVPTSLTTRGYCSYPARRLRGRRLPSAPTLRTTSSSPASSPTLFPSPAPLSMWRARTDVLATAHSICSTYIFWTPRLDAWGRRQSGAACLSP